jgi:hypothetical protein
MANVLNTTGVRVNGHPGVARLAALTRRFPLCFLRVLFFLYANSVMHSQRRRVMSAGVHLLSLEPEPMSLPDSTNVNHEFVKEGVVLVVSEVCVASACFLTTTSPQIVQ